MRLEQHIYTSGKREFTTVAATEGIKQNRAARLKLENHSLYILPASLLYQENGVTPVKHVYYRLDEQQFVVGRAIYIGKDSLGRPGNYLFHNFMISKEDLMRFAGLNPVRLILWLEEHGCFTETVPTQEALDVLKIDETKIKAPQYRQLDVPRDLLSSVLYVGLEHESLPYPILLTGTDQQCLEFLDRIYPLLPYHLRETFSFDTYMYGVDLDFKVVGIPEEPEYRPNLTTSVSLTLNSRQYTSSLEFQGESKRLALITEMSAAGRIADLNLIYSLEHCLRIEDYPRFKAEYRDVSAELKSIIIDFHKTTLLQQIAGQQDPDLLELIRQDIVVEDLDILASSPEMVHQFVATAKRKEQEIFADWLCVKDEKASFYPFLFEFHSLWKVFLEKITTQPEHIAVLLGPLQTFSKQYSMEFEKSLVNAMMTLLPVIMQEKKLTKEFLSRVEALPPAESEMFKVFRTTIKYELSKSPEVLQQLLDSDCSRLSPDYQRFVLHVILRGMFDTMKAEEMEKQVKILFERASKQTEDLLTLLSVLEQIQLSKKVRKVLQKVLTKIPEKFPKDDRLTGEISNKIGQILKPPPSFFKKIAEKVLWKI